MGFHTIIAERKGESSSGKMRSLVALTLLLAVAAGDMMLKKKIHHDMMLMNSQAMCWGQGNMMYYKMAMMKALDECTHGGHTTSTKPTSPFAQLNKPRNPFQTLPASIQAKNPFSGNSFNKKPTVNPDSLKSILFSNFDSRKKRQADGLIEGTEEDFAEFLGDFADFKDDVASKMSNLTCVLRKMDMPDDDYQVNLKSYTETFWKNIDMSQTLAGEDPIWRQMMIDGYNDCYDVARSFPQSALDKNPIMKVFGRLMVFFKCTRKVETHCCDMACANNMLETLYGDSDNYDWSQYGIPNNKYERAAMFMKVTYSTATPEEEFVHNFFYEDPMM